MRKLLIVLVALLLVTGSGVRQAYSADDAKPAVHPATANQAAAGKKVKATGTIEPEEVVNVCAQVPGKIVSLARTLAPRTSASAGIHQWKRVPSWRRSTASSIRCVSNSSTPPARVPEPSWHR